MKVSKGAKIRSRYNQVPHSTQDTNGKVKFGGGECHGASYKTYFYFYFGWLFSDLEECLPIGPATSVRFPVGTG